MYKSIAYFVVRLSALMSFLGLISGYRNDDLLLKVSEVIMLGIWLQMDFKLIKSLFKQ